jgi:hypothetical protein
VNTRGIGTEAVAMAVGAMTATRAQAGLRRSPGTISFDIRRLRRSTHGLAGTQAGLLLTVPSATCRRPSPNQYPK